MRKDIIEKISFAENNPIVICPTCCAGHAPFLFYLMDLAKPKKVVSLGVWYGFSHFVFCQASSNLEIGAECHAVDSWEGDKNMGQFSSSVYDFFSKQMHQFFPKQLPYIHKKLFAQAIPDFADGSIDILFIDGAHSFEDVRSDFYSWLPKMSERGIVLLHDTAVSGENFGVFKFFREISNEYPSFNFEHNHGLGILLTGEKNNDLLVEICKTNTCEFKKIQDLFAKVGRSLELEVECSNLRKQLSTALHQNELIKKSFSWRITSPIRFFQNLKLNNF